MEMYPENNRKIILKWMIYTLVLVALVLIIFLAAVFFNNDLREENRVRGLIENNSNLPLDFKITSKLKISDLSGRRGQLNQVQSYSIPYGRIYSIDTTTRGRHLFFDGRGNYLTTCSMSASTNTAAVLPICGEFFDFIFAEGAKFKYDYWFMPDSDGSDSGTYRQWIDDGRGGGVGVIRYEDSSVSDSMHQIDIVDSASDNLESKSQEDSTGGATKICSDSECFKLGFRDCSSTIFQKQITDDVVYQYEIIGDFDCSSIKDTEQRLQCDENEQFVVGFTGLQFCRFKVAVLQHPEPSWIGKEKECLSSGHDLGDSSLGDGDATCEGELQGLQINYVHILSQNYSDCYSNTDPERNLLSEEELKECRKLDCQIKFYNDSPYDAYGHGC